MGNTLFAVIIILLAAYVFYAAVQLSRKPPVIISSVEMMHGRNISSCRDPEGFAAYMKIRVWILGAVMMLSGVVSLIINGTDLMDSWPTAGAILGIGSVLLFIVYLILYMHWVRKADGDFFIK